MLDERVRNTFSTGSTVCKLQIELWVAGAPGKRPWTGPLAQKMGTGTCGEIRDRTERDTAEAEDSVGRAQTFMPTDYRGIWYPFLEALSLSCSCVTASWINCFKDARETQPATKSDLTVWLWWVCSEPSRASMGSAEPPTEMELQSQQCSPWWWECGYQSALWTVRQESFLIHEKLR